MPSAMQADLISVAAFGWIVTLLAYGVAGPWLVVDILRLRRALRDDVAQPAVRDRVFGSIIGMIIAVIGLVGATLHQLHS